VRAWLTRRKTFSGKPGLVDGARQLLGGMDDQKEAFFLVENPALKNYNIYDNFDPVKK
jgi:hypothetical protein